MSSALKHAVNRGKLVAATLAGSWHQRPIGVLNISESELNEITPLLYDSGAGGLAWWRLRQTDLVERGLLGYSSRHIGSKPLQSVQHEKKIEKVFRLLHQSLIDAILLKGWLAARLYPDQALRPYGDIDIYIRPQHFKHA